MSVLSDQSIFAAMKQDGPFAVEESVSLDRPFSRRNREWVRRLMADQVQTTKYRAVRSQIFNLLQVQDFAAIQRLLSDERQKRACREQAHRLIARLFNIEVETRQIQTKLHEFAATADAVIDYLRNKVLTPYAPQFEISNEIATTMDPVDLLLIIFDDRYHMKVRFEAKRKLVLMNLAGAIDQRERETDIESRFSGFLRFLNEHVWSPQLRIGEHRSIYLLSDHDPTDYRCTRVQMIDVDKASGLALQPHQHLTFVKRRLFRPGTRDIPVYVSVRKKIPAAKVLKLLRKNEKNPAVAVDDELGLMAVLDGRAEVNRFVEHLTKAAVRSGVLMTLEDISDTLDGGGYAAGSAGSSSDTPMMKFFARLGDTRVEFIIHTNQSYLDYHYRHGVSHDEYEVRRIFDSGVAEFLFPQNIYHLGMADLRDRLVARFRDNK
ncbi:MAG TPA: hypothetical protein VET88_13445 [Gammaproteobacteria bacterium]|nr:hypothetical protein [Gammaproteobacteria bacterium]